MEEKIEIGTALLVGLRWLMVEEIQGTLLFCIDQDGKDWAIETARVDRILS